MNRLILTIMHLLFVACASTARVPATDVSTQEEEKAQATDVQNETSEASQQSEEEVKELTAQEKATNEIYSTASKKLEEFVEKAKADGETSVKFMGSDLFLKATDASMRGDFRTSSFLYKFVLDLFPNDLYLKKKFAIDLIRSGEVTQAEGLLQSVYTEENGKDENIALVLAGLYTAQDKPAQARQTYQKILKKHPKSEEACVFLAKSFAVEEKFGQAIEILQNCDKKTGHKNAIYSYYMGKMELTKENRNKAREYFQAALKIDPSYFQAALGLGLMQEEKENYEGAMNIYKNFVMKNPDNSVILGRLVQVQFALSKFKDALQHVEHLVSLDSTDLNMRVRLGILYTDAGKFDEAKKTFIDILNEVPDSDKVTFYLAALYHHTGNIEPAIEMYNKIGQDSSLYFDSNLQIASILQAKASEETASETDVENFLSFLDEKSALSDDMKMELSLIKAFYLDKRGDLNAALSSMDWISDFEKVSDTNMYQMAAIYEKAKQFEKSDKMLMTLIEKSPKNAHALNFLGYSLIERGERMDEALEYINLALTIRPDDGYIVDSLGWYHYKKGDFKKALKEIKRAHKLVKDDSTIIKHLAIVYSELKMYDQAKHHYAEALKHCQDKQEKQLIMDSLNKLENFVRLPASGGH